MYTKEEQPWVEYFEIDEETLESKLRPDTPENIRKLYDTYVKEKEEKMKNGIPIFK